MEDGEEGLFNIGPWLNVGVTMEILGHGLPLGIVRGNSVESGGR